MDVSDRQSSDSFAAVVRGVFDFLESVYGFRFVDASSEVVKFESASVVVRIYREKISQEVGLRVATKLDPKRDFDLGHVIALSDEELGWSYRDSEARPPNNLQAALEQTAAQLLRYGKSALNGESTAFATLHEISDRFIQRDAAERRARIKQRAAESGNSI